MTPKERIKLMLGNKEVDRPGVALWKHFSLVDRDKTNFVNKTVGFQEENNWDLIKVSYNGFYFVEGWGAEVKWPTTKEESDSMYTHPPFKKYVIDDPVEWDSFKAIPANTNAFARELEATKKIIEHFKGNVPILPTIFSPLTSAQGMTGSFTRPDLILAQMKYHPERVHKALEIITEVTINFIEELVKLGIDGIFFAVQLSRHELMTPKAFKEFGKKYDLMVLDTIKDKTWFNMAHIHGKGDLMFDEIKEYPVQALNWEDLGTSMSLKEASKITDKILVGGLEHEVDFNEPDREKLINNLKKRVQCATEQVNSNRLIIGPGCTVPNYVPEDGFSALKEVVNGLKR